MFYSRGLGVGLNIFTGSGGISVEDLGIPASIYHTGTEYYPRNPWYIKAWGGKIYLANGNTANFGPSPNSGCCILSYNPANGAVTNELTCDDEMVMYFREIGGELYAPGCDLKPGSGTENYYRLRSGTWSKITAVPFSDHNFDMCEFDGKIFACGGTSGTSVAAYSTDGGATFTNITTAFSRGYCLIPFNGDLYVSGNAGGGYLFTPPYTFQSGLYLWKWDGTGFTKQSTSLAPGFTSMSDEFTVRRALEFSGKLLHITGSHLNDHATIPVGLFVCPTNLASASQVSLDTGEIPYDMIKYGGAVHLLTSKPNGSGAYVTRIRTSTDASSWPVLFEFTTPSFGLSFDILDSAYYIGIGTDMTGYTTPVADTGRLYRVTL